MSLRVWAWDANPAVDRGLYRQSNIRAQEIVDSGRGVYITLPNGRTAVQLLPPPPKQATIRQVMLEDIRATAALIPFSKPSNGDRLHYQIPMAGDLGIRRHDLYRRFNVLLRSRIKVSARKIDFTTAPYLPTQTRGVTFAASVQAPTSSLMQLA